MRPRPAHPRTWRPQGLCSHGHLEMPSSRAHTTDDISIMAPKQDAGFPETASVEHTASWADTGVSVRAQSP